MEKIELNSFRGSRLHCIVDCGRCYPPIPLILLRSLSAAATALAPALLTRPYMEAFRSSRTAAAEGRGCCREPPPSESEAALSLKLSSRKRPLVKALAAAALLPEESFLSIVTTDCADDIKISVSERYLYKKVFFLKKKKQLSLCWKLMVALIFLPLQKA